MKYRVCQDGRTKSVDERAEGEVREDLMSCRGNHLVQIGGCICTIRRRSFGRGRGGHIIRDVFQGILYLYNSNISQEQNTVSTPNTAPTDKREIW